MDVDLKRNLGADSMDLVDILEAIEVEFDIEVGEEKAASILNVGQAVSVIKELVDAKEG
jgi:acyl carrier protein